MLEPFDVEAQHQRQAVDGHLLDGALLQPAPLARPPLAGAQALRPHKTVQAADQARRAVLRNYGRRACSVRNGPMFPPDGAGLPRRVSRCCCRTGAVARSCGTVIRGRSAGRVFAAGRAVKGICGRGRAAGCDGYG